LDKVEHFLERSVYNSLYILIILQQMNEMKRLINDTTVQCRLLTGVT